MTAATEVRHSISIMDKTGDIKTTWNPNKPDEVAMARKVFDDAIAKGFSVFNADPDGEQGVRMKSFDPQAARMIGVAPIQAG